MPSTNPLALPRPPIRATILSGFLGAGKTTLLNRYLASDTGRRVAVLENEFGAVGIDGGLIAGSPAVEVVELTDGCVCCSVRGELGTALAELADRRERGELDFDHLVLETTGLADPAPVAQAFFVDEGVRERYELDGILTVVDAVHAQRQLDENRVAAAQVGFADRVLLSKTELVAPAELEALETRLRHINLRVPVQAIPQGDAELKALFALDAFVLSDVLDHAPGFLSSASPNGLRRGGARQQPFVRHDDDISSLVLHHPGAVDVGLMGSFVEELLLRRGNDMLRYKGILAVRGEARRLVFQGVHRITGFDYGRPWEDGEARESTIVIIGRRLDTPAIESAFALACR
ncbi:GTP-binding protein [Zoogloea sp.]|uniref:CobW family GTP-binding protein n=1 Tax=Zoogloea sp. TaxID=49181 RepID=UPI0014159344|nr:MAG: GTP-binding protein [Zoogloea sp.]